MKRQEGRFIPQKMHKPSSLKVDDRKVMTSPKESPNLEIKSNVSIVEKMGI